MRFALLALLGVGCIQAARLPIEHKALKAQIEETEKDKWARECAPEEMAMAIAHREFAELEFEQGDARQ